MNEKTELSDERIKELAEQQGSWGASFGYSKESDFEKPVVPKHAYTFARAIEAELRAASPSSKSAKEVGPFDVLPPEIEGRLSVWLTLGKELHPLTVNLVVRFARALAAKLADAEQKYGYSDGWRSPDWMDECRAHLMEHIAKGDPRDVAAYCAFLWHHGESTALASSSIKEDGERAEPLTDEQIMDLATPYYPDSIQFARRIEAAHGIGSSSPPSPLGDTPDQPKD